MTNYDILEALNNVDDECVKKTKTDTIKRQKNNKSFRLRWGAMVACLCLLLVVSIMAIYQIQNRANPSGPNIPPVTGNNPDSQLTVEQGICVGGKLYMPDTELSEKATKENIGSFAGCVSYDNKMTLDVCAFEYVPNDGKTSRVIVSANNEFYVYSFYSYMQSDNEGWIIDLLGKAAYAESRYINNGATDETVCSRISDLDAITKFLSSLNKPLTQNELDHYYFDKFKNHFKEGEVWLSKDGGIAFGGNQIVCRKFYNLVDGKFRIIVVVMEDNTYLTYSYFEGAGVIRLEDTGYGYILTEDQIEEINHLIDLN